MSVGQDDAGCRVLRQHLTSAPFPLRSFPAGTRPEDRQHVQAAAGESNTLVQRKLCAREKARHHTVLGTKEDAYGKPF